MKTTQTWQDVLNVLLTLSPEQLAQTSQVTRSSPIGDHVYEGQAIICLGTIDELELDYFRSATDNRRHGDEIVAFTDGNPFAKNGAVAWELKPGGNINDDDSMIPIFSKDHTPDQDWTGPAQKVADENLASRETKEISNHNLAVLIRRINTRPGLELLREPGLELFKELDKSAT